MTITVDPSKSPDRLPIKQCSGRFCVCEAPATESEIAVALNIKANIIGYCHTCERYLCDGCSLFEDVVGNDGTPLHLLKCISCGCSLGSPDHRMTVENDFSTTTRDSGLNDELIGDFFREAILAGHIESVALRRAKAKVAEGNHQEAIGLLQAEAEECRRANFELGLLETLNQLVYSFITLQRLSDARAVAQQEDALSQRLEDPAKRVRAMLSIYLTQDEQRTTQEKIADLNALEAAAKGVNEKIAQFCEDERAGLYLESGKVVPSVRRLLKADDSRKRLRAMLDLLLAQSNLSLETKTRPPNWRPRPFDEDQIKRMAETHDVWACPNSCRFPGMTGWIGLPKKSQGGQSPCFVCGSPNICINKYSKLYATVPDRPMPSFLPERVFGDEVAEAVILFNLSLCYRIQFDDETAEELQQLAIEFWREKFGVESNEFIQTLNMVARILQDRDEHECALAVLHMAIETIASWEEASVENRASLLNNLGLSLACLGRFDEAEKVLVEAGQILPDFANPFYWMAKLYQTRAHEGDQAKELAAWHSFLRMNGGTEMRRNEGSQRVAKLEGRDVIQEEDESENAQEQALADLDWLSLFESAANPEKALQGAEEKVNQLRNKGPTVELYNAFQNWISLLVQNEDWQKAEPLCSEQVETATSLKNNDLLLAALALQVDVSLKVNNLTVALDANNRQIEIAEQVNDKSNVESALYFRATIFGRMNKLEDAIQDAKRALTLFVEGGEVNNVSACCELLASFHNRRGEWTEAKSMHELREQLCRSNADPDLLLNALVGLADFYRDRDDHESALRTYKETEELARQADNPTQLVVSLYEQSQLLEDDEPFPILELSKEIIEICRHQIMRLSIQQNQTDQESIRAWRQNILLGCRIMDKSVGQLARLGSYLHTKLAFEDLIKSRKESFEQDPDHGDLQASLARSLSEMAVTCARLNPTDNYHEAERQMMEAVETMESVLNRVNEGSYVIDAVELRRTQTQICRDLDELIRTIDSNEDSRLTACFGRMVDESAESDLTNLIVQAQQKETKGDYLGALESYQAVEQRFLALRDCKQAVSTRLKQARIWFVAGDQEFANSLYDSCESMSRQCSDPDTIMDVLLQRISVFLNLSQYERAGKAIDELETLGREHENIGFLHDAMHQRVDLFVKQKWIEQAIEASTDLLDSCRSTNDQANEISALAQRARLLDSAESLEAAVDVWTQLESLARANKLDGQFYQARAARAALLHRLGLQDEAGILGNEVMEWYHKLNGLSDVSLILEFAPALGRGWPEMGLALARQHIQRADMLVDKGEYGSASFDFQLARLLAPDSPEVLNALAWFWATCPDKNSRNGQQAVIVGKEACEQSNWNAWEVLDTYSAALAEIGEFTQALEIAAKALESAPDESARQTVLTSQQKYLSGKTILEDL